ncbi:MAG TPA: type VI secretion system contractile sheath large subunit [Tepidisphaeraceae bacterium]|jgi:type VI secretion system protein ImpD
MSAESPTPDGSPVVYLSDAPDDDLTSSVPPDWADVAQAFVPEAPVSEAFAPPPPSAPELPELDLLSLVLEATGAGASPPSPNSVQVLRNLVREAAADGEALREFKNLLACAVARLDQLVTRQINRILHHPRFQQLEASWRGLHYLVEHSDSEEGIKVRMLNASWSELARDVERALEFDQSTLFHKVYEDEFGMPGGEPFGVLIGDYSIRHQSTADHPIDDISVLTSISQVAAAAFAPFIASVHPSVLGLDQFSGLELPLNLERLFEQKEYLRWKLFRESVDSRFVGLTLPRVLMRLPYEESTFSSEQFCFREDVSSSQGNNYLWGNPAYALGAVLTRSFSRSRWLADIRGVRRGEEGGGLVTGLPIASFETDAQGVALRFPTDITITDLQERALAELGLIPLCVCKDTEFCAFYGNQSVQKAKAYTDASATANARISAMLQYILCASRFAHYLKIIGRDKTGSVADPYELSNYLSNWLMKYTLDDANASPDMKARYPLRGFEVNVREQPDKPGAFFCELLLLPHSQWDELSLGVRLVTDLAPLRSV